MEKVKKIKNVVIIRQPLNLNDLMKKINYLKKENELVFETVRVVKTSEISNKEYDMLTSDFYTNNLALLTHKGGFSYNIRNVIEVKSKNRTTLYIDPDGNQYPINVGIQFIINND